MSEKKHEKILQAHEITLQREEGRDLPNVIAQINNRIAELKGRIEKLNVCVNQGNEINKAGKAGIGNSQYFKFESFSEVASFEPPKFDCLTNVRFDVHGSVKFAFMPYPINIDFTVDKFDKSEIYRKMESIVIRELQKFKYRLAKSKLSELDELLTYMPANSENLQKFNELVGALLKDLESNGWFNFGDSSTNLSEEDFIQLQKEIKDFCDSLLKSFPKIKMKPRYSQARRSVYWVKRYENVEKGEMNYYLQFWDKTFKCKYYRGSSSYKYLINSDDIKAVFHQTPEYNEEDCIEIGANEFMQLKRLIGAIHIKMHRLQKIVNCSFSGKPQGINISNSTFHLTTTSIPNICAGKCKKVDVASLIKSHVRPNSIEVQDEAPSIQNKIREKIKQLEEKLTIIANRENS